MAELAPKPIVVFDVDDTTLDENRAIREFVNVTYGATHTPEDYLVSGQYNMYWEGVWKLPPDEGYARYKRFIASEAREQILPVPGAPEALQILSETHALVALTSRKINDAAMTHRTLELHFPGLFSAVHFDTAWRSEGEKVPKAEICKELGAICLVDDNVDHCIVAAEAGIEVVLFGDLGWNRWQTLPAGIKRVATMDAVVEHIQGIGK